ncbi:MAG: sarcosine oxidase subunit delta [Pseudonocardia sp.]
MMLLPCPFCGTRDVGEFRYVGEIRTRPDPDTVTPTEWRRYLYFHTNRLGWVSESWYHGSGCRRYITVERHSGTNQVRRAGGAA